MAFKVFATSLKTGKVRMFDKKDFKTVQDIKDAAFSSCALSPVFLPHNIGDEYFVDGGVMQNTPVRYAVADGHKEI
eukprot:CAMPEP_0116893456 /NCGR_PEP_ID=MMETSP0467-20121206/3436_1 /TAXON_ID=283647 /ORGANISM="Mesodinium pulex, Strain SPMC105" /LENGTH=75 /DNA_ID=CAMNT_0004563117 /DNA_START=434 /DNA_END=661 /DNA_ORIENTATION=+